MRDFIKTHLGPKPGQDWSLILGAFLLIWFHSSIPELAFFEIASMVSHMDGRKNKNTNFRIQVVINLTGVMITWISSEKTKTVSAISQNQKGKSQKNGSKVPKTGAVPPTPWDEMDGVGDRLTSHPWFQEPGKALSSLPYASRLLDWPTLVALLPHPRCDPSPTPPLCCSFCSFTPPPNIFNTPWEKNSIINKTNNSASLKCLQLQWAHR